MRGLATPEPDRDPSVREGGSDARRFDLERPTEAGEVGGQDSQVFRSLGTRVRRMELVDEEAEGLRAAAAFYWMGCLLGGPREQDLEPAEWTAQEGTGERLALVARRRCRTPGDADSRRGRAGAVGGTLSRRAALATCGCRARVVEIRGHRRPSLVDCGKVVPLTRAEERRVSGEGGGRFDELVRERARTLVDDARISTFDRLGENTRALSILERRLGRDRDQT